MLRCPGQDQRYWKPEDVFEVRCPGCGAVVEFFKDEPRLKCRKCGQTVANPKIDLGCVKWCRYGQQCLGVSAGKIPKSYAKGARQNIRDKRGAKK